MYFQLLFLFRVHFVVSSLVILDGPRQLQCSTSMYTTKRVYARRSAKPFEITNSFWSYLFNVFYYFLCYYYLIARCWSGTHTYIYIYIYIYIINKQKRKKTKKTKKKIAAISIQMFLLRAFLFIYFIFFFFFFFFYYYFSHTFVWQNLSPLFFFCFFYGGKSNAPSYLSNN